MSRLRHVKNTNNNGLEFLAEKWQLQINLSVRCPPVIKIISTSAFPSSIQTLTNVALKMLRHRNPRKCIPIPRSIGLWLSCSNVLSRNILALKIHVFLKVMLYILIRSDIASTIHIWISLFLQDKDGDCMIYCTTTRDLTEKALRGKERRAGRRLSNHIAISYTAEVEFPRPSSS